MEVVHLNEFVGLLKTYVLNVFPYWGHVFPVENVQLSWLSWLENSDCIIEYPWCESLLLFRKAWQILLNLVLGPHWPQYLVYSSKRSSSRSGKDSNPPKRSRSPSSSPERAQKRSRSRSSSGGRKRRRSRSRSSERFGLLWKHHNRTDLM